MSASHSIPARLTALAGAACLVLVLCGGLAGCSDDDPTPVTPVDQPDPTYATVTFTFDDSAGATYDDGDGLAWKATFSYDDATGIAAVTGGWDGPFVPLHDDGPAAGGGHEPDGATAGDHLWSAAVLVPTPAADIDLDYGVIHGSTGGGDGDWVTGTTQGTVTIPAGATGTVTAAPMTAPAFVPPADHALVTFTIDDSANATYGVDDGLAWKGNFGFDAATRVLTVDGAWGGPYVLLYDDGPWTDGGHEPVGGVAGDHLWSVAVWLDSSAAVTLEYGAISGSVNGSDGSWIWSGPNGTVTIPAGSDGPVAAPGLVIPAFGTIDLRLTIDVSSDGANLAAGFTGTYGAGSVAVKGDQWRWNTVTMVDDGTAGDVTAGDGIFTYVMSEQIGPHDGLLYAAETAQFVFVLNGVEYKTAGSCATDGVAAATDTGAGWTSADVLVDVSGDRNTYVVAP